MHIDEKIKTRIAWCLMRNVLSTYMNDYLQVLLTGNKQFSQARPLKEVD